MGVARNTWERLVQVQRCCLTCAETVRTISDGKPRTATSTFTESERTRESNRQSDEHWNRFKGNVGETSERRGGAHMGFSELTDSILTLSEQGKGLAAHKNDNCCTHRPFDIGHENSVFTSPAETRSKRFQKKRLASCDTCFLQLPCSPLLTQGYKQQQQQQNH